MKDRREQGVHARNQAFRRYEQVNKPQDYRLSEGDDQEAFDETTAIETCDFSRWLSGDAQERAGFAADLGAALEGIGFAILTGHGVDPELHESARSVTRELFESTTEAERLRFLARRVGSINQGYFPVKETTLIHPDLVQGWVFCRRAFNLGDDPDFNALDFWPHPRFEQALRPLVQAQEALILPLMQAMLTHLGCDPHLWDERLRATNFGFRLNYYPPLDSGSGAEGGRMLGHEDVDLFTFLPAPSEEGLQVLNRRNMRWIRLDAPPGSLIINTGDYMQRLSNDRFPSTTHRVARPRDPAVQALPRVSFPMAIYTWEDELLEVLPNTGEPHYPPIRAIEFHTAITAKYYGDDYSVKG